jgi:hypothetical protein
LPRHLRQCVIQRITKLEMRPGQVSAAADAGTKPAAAGPDAAAILSARAVAGPRLAGYSGFISEAVA